MFRFFDRAVTSILLDSKSWRLNFRLVSKVESQLYQTGTTCPPILVSGIAESRRRPLSSRLCVWEVAKTSSVGQGSLRHCKLSLTGVNRLDLFSFCTELKIKLPDFPQGPMASCLPFISGKDWVGIMTSASCVLIKMAWISVFKLSIVLPYRELSALSSPPSCLLCVSSKENRSTGNEFMGMAVTVSSRCRWFTKVLWSRGRRSAGLVLKNLNKSLFPFLCLP